VYSWLIREPPALLAAGERSRITVAIATGYPARAQACHRRGAATVGLRARDTDWR
jgi:hypothetical protein